MTLLLAQTALLFVIQDSLPKLTYYSILDEYIMWNFVLTAICSIQTGIFSLDRLDEDVASRLDKYCLVGVSLLLLGINVFYVFDLGRNWKRNHGKKYRHWYCERNDAGFVDKEERFGFECTLCLRSNDQFCQIPYVTL